MIQEEVIGLLNNGCFVNRRRYCCVNIAGMQSSSPQECCTREQHTPLSIERWMLQVSIHHYSTLWLNTHGFASKVCYSCSQFFKFCRPYLLCVINQMRSIVNLKHVREKMFAACASSISCSNSRPVAWPWVEVGIEGYRGVLHRENNQTQVLFCCVCLPRPCRSTAGVKRFPDGFFDKRGKKNRHEM